MGRLLGNGRRGLAIEKQELGPQQAATFGAALHGESGVGFRSDVREDLDAAPIGDEAFFIFVSMP